MVLRLILESNEKRKEEVKDEGVRGEVEKIKKRVEALERMFDKEVWRKSLVFLK